MSAYDYTTGYGFVLINYQTQGWQTEEYSNWRKLDNLLSTLSDLSIPFAVATGATDAFVVDYDPAITALNEGTLISFEANNTITGPATVNVNGLGAKDLYRDGAPLTAGNIVTLDFVKAIYDGTRFLVIQPQSAAELIIPDASITPAKLSIGHPGWDASGNATVGGTFAASGSVTTNGSIVVSHANTTLTSGKVYVSTDNPSGGSNGDFWFKYTA